MTKCCCNGVDQTTHSGDQPVFWELQKQSENIDIALDRELNGRIIEKKGEEADDDGKTAVVLLKRLSTLITAGLL